MKFTEEQLTNLCALMGALDCELHGKRNKKRLKESAFKVAKRLFKIKCSNKRQLFTIISGMVEEGLKERGYAG